MLTAKNKIYILLLIQGNFFKDINILINKTLSAIYATVYHFCTQIIFAIVFIFNIN